MADKEKSYVCGRDCAECPDQKNCEGQVDYWDDYDIINPEAEEKSIEIQDEILGDHFEGHLNQED